MSISRAFPALRHLLTAECAGVSAELAVLRLTQKLRLRIVSGAQLERA